MEIVTNHYCPKCEYFHKTESCPKCDPLPASESSAPTTQEVLDLLELVERTVMGWWCPDTIKEVNAMIKKLKQNEGRSGE